MIEAVATVVVLVGVAAANTIEVAPCNLAGVYLDYDSSFPVERWSIVQFDQDGIPMVKYGGEYFYNATTISQWGLQGYSRWFMDHSRQESKRQAIKAADWLVENQVKESGAWVHRYSFSVSGLNLEPAWPSALTQGQAMSLLTRAYRLEPKPEYLEAALLAIQPLTVSIQEGGVRSALFGGAFYEEYPTSPPTYTLNGMLLCLIGLTDIWQTTGSLRAVTLLLEGVQMITFLLPYYDLEGERISTYSLLHLAVPGAPPVRASKAYHQLHVMLLRVLGSVTWNRTLSAYARKWARYGGGP